MSVVKREKESMRDLPEEKQRKENTMRRDRRSDEGTTVVVTRVKTKREGRKDDKSGF